MARLPESGTAIRPNHTAAKFRAALEFPHFEPSNGMNPNEYDPANPNQDVGNKIGLMVLQAALAKIAAMEASLEVKENPLRSVLLTSRD